MSNGYGKAKAVAELALKFGFPGAGTTAIATAGVGQDQQLPTAIIAITAVAPPPTGDGVDGEGGRVMRDAYEDRASVGEQVIDTVRDGDADRIGTEVVVIDAHRCAVPLDAIVLEVADQFSFFGINADDRQPLALKAGTQ